MRALASVLIVASMIALSSPPPVAAGMQAPATVFAGVGGKFSYEWKYVVEQSFLIAGLGWSDAGNTRGAIHGDCFCDPTFCAANAGDTIRWQVSGTLVDSTQMGTARNWLAGCEGQGGQTYTTILPRGTTGVGDFPAALDLALSSLPNPCRDRATFTYALPAAGRITLALYDLSGRRIATWIDGEETAGAHSIVRDLTGARGPLSDGVYFARLAFGGSIRTRRILVTR